MKKIFVYISVLVLAVSCTDMSSLNKDNKKADVVPGEMLFSNAVKGLYDKMVSNSVNLNVFRLLAQQQAQVTYIDESRYDLATRNIPQFFWQDMYRDVLKDLADGKRLISADEALTDVEATIKGNKLAIIDVVEVYANFVLVTAYGNIPYTETMDVNILNPKFDDQKTVYYDLLDRLDADIAQLNDAQGSFGTADMIYQGDVTKWIRFTNSLRLKMALVIADEDKAKAITIVNDAAAGVFQSNDDNAILQYLSVEPNTNPIWVDLVKSGRTDYVIANTLVNLMNDRNDPRRPFYMTAVTPGVYIGGTYGSGNSYESFSHVSNKIVAANFEGLLIDYAEVEFALAEAVARGGFSVPGTVEEHYNKGITASITYWGGTPAAAATYLLQPSVIYATAAGTTWQQKIGTQKYIALYNRGYDAWLEWRRLNYPTFNAPNDIPYTSIPVRLTYPVSEQNLNQRQYEAAADAIGGDALTTKLFWDKN